MDYITIFSWCEQGAISFLFTLLLIGSLVLIKFSERFKYEFHIYMIW